MLVTTSEINCKMKFEILTLVVEGASGAPLIFP